MFARCVIGGALSTLVLICASAAVGAETVIGPRLTVRLYDSFGILESDLKIAQRTADTIFGRAGVHVAWRLCRASSGLSGIAPERCADIVRAHEIGHLLLGTTVHAKGGLMRVALEHQPARTATAAGLALFAR
jgi:hypothetical protein